MRLVHLRVMTDEIRTFFRAHGLRPEGSPMPGFLFFEDGMVTFERFTCDESDKIVYRDGRQYFHYPLWQVCPWPDKRMARLIHEDAAVSLKAMGVQVRQFTRMNSTLAFFFRAHDVDPALVPLPGRITLKDGVVTYQRFAVGRDGRIVRHNGEPCRQTFQVEQKFTWPVAFEAEHEVKP